MSATVTIVTPAFNAAKYIAETIDSVQAQTWRDWEWIVVDDGSTDDTPRLLDARATVDDRITVIRQRSYVELRGVRTESPYWLSRRFGLWLRQSPGRTRVAMPSARRPQGPRLSRRVHRQTRRP